MQEIINDVISNPIILSIFAIIVGIFVYMLIKRILNRFNKRKESNPYIEKKRKTYVKLLVSMSKYIIMLIVLMVVLQINGVDVTSIIAGLGIVSVIAGLALQDALKDIIMGFNIILDDYFSVGDVVKIGNVEGKVIEIGLKATKIKDIISGNLLVISNRSIGQAINVSDKLFIDVPLPYNEKVERVEKIMEQVIEEIQKDEEVKEVEYLGLSEFADSKINYKIRILTNPENKLRVKRFANRVIKKTLDDNNIEIPFMQIDIHNV